MRGSKLNHNCITVDIWSSFSFSLFSLSFASHAPWCCSQDQKYSSFHNRSLTGVRHAQMGADRQSMRSQGVTDTWCWWTHWVAYRFAYDWQLYLLSHTHSLGAPTVSDVTLLSSVLRCSHTLCLMLMSNLLSNDCVWVKKNQMKGPLWNSH